MSFEKYNHFPTKQTNSHFPPRLHPLQDPRDALFTVSGTGEPTDP